MSLMVSISGVRGIVGTSLTPEVLVKYARAFAGYTRRGTIVLGRDGRVSGKLLGNIVSSTLLAAGCDVIALGVVPTPTIAIAVEKLGAAGGISLTASHNPIEWNGLKFMGPSGMFLDAAESRLFWNFAEEQAMPYARWDAPGAHRRDDSFIERHIDSVLALPFFDAEAIRRRGFRIVVDSVNAAGGLIVPQLLRRLGCTVIEMNCDVSGIFSRMPEPVPENLTGLCRRVVSEHADAGIAVDPDVDRLALVDESGTPFGEEYTVTAVVKFVLEKRKRENPGSAATVVVNLSTTRAVDDVAKEFGATVLRTPVGEINVAARMKESGALVGGEGSGGVILPALHYGRDAIVGIGLILQQLAEFGGTLSQLRSTLPRYSMAKSKVQLSGRDAGQVLREFGSQSSKNGNVNNEDGIKIMFDDSWVHLRNSNTEPVVRIIAEATTSEGAEELTRRYTGLLLATGVRA
jgi:phosphomannomutase